MRSTPARQAAETAKAGQAARTRVENGKALILNAEQAFCVMRVRYDVKYWVAKPSQMSGDDIDNAQWLLIGRGVPIVASP